MSLIMKQLDQVPKPEKRELPKKNGEFVRSVLVLFCGLALAAFIIYGIMSVIPHLDAPSAKNVKDRD